MAAVSHGWKPMRMKGPTMSVAKEFHEADKHKRSPRAMALMKAMKERGHGHG